jgi:VIT1/CCC1 family predicted Fe2+/Mn2+ transporter
MIILGSVLVVLGLVLQTQTLWAVGAVLIAAGLALSALGTTGPRYRGRSFRW